MKILKTSNTQRDFIIDDEDFIRVSLFSWVDGGSRLQGFVKGKIISLANFLKRDNLKYDHKDRNYLNNQKDNLRECTNSQNMANRDKYFSFYTSQYKGVRYRKGRKYHKKPWHAEIKINKKQKHLGSFKTEEEAAITYNLFAKQLFGEFAVLNVIEG